MTLVADTRQDAANERCSKISSSAHQNLPGAAAAALDALIAAHELNRDRGEYKGDYKRATIPFIISSLEILIVPQPQVSPHTQGCSHGHRESER
jgi:hypothetical protein